MDKEYNMDTEYNEVSYDGGYIVILDGKTKQYLFELKINNY